MIQSFLTHPLDLVRINSGMYFYGALTGGLVAGLWNVRRQNLHFWSIADSYGLYAPLVISISRFGCLFENVCYGVRGSPPLAIVFPGLTQPRYPSELYEGLFSLLIFGVLMWLGQRNVANGTIFLAFLIGYPLGRALIDLTRINLGGYLGPVDPILSLGVALTAVLMLFWIRRSHVDGRTGDIAGVQNTPGGVLG
jgi:phosphatidylglycerol:prolipoprotein diacylglycerol transferase